MNCANCSAPMDRVAADGVYGTAIELDLCFACHVMWLDDKESIQLSPRGTLDLFQIIYQHRADPRHAIGKKLACGRCKRPLSLKRDIGKYGRLSYYACPAKHGRLTPFSEFLKEKQFVRELSQTEQNRVRAELREVQCSSCGARVDLMKAFQCAHCGSPIAVLDADAVEKTVRQLEVAEEKRSGGDPATKEARARALAYMEGMRTRPEKLWERGVGRGSPGGEAYVDLLSASIGALINRFL
jgi:DNA-directed RNA polymerase subunit RPC12/RpoP